ncbi:hypothetical protein VaNZ11_011542 [Volvox africanus]|uniref:Solute carrier family 40 member n=1 Tax=Volvox africanus TaxID=51714 RepID=A0ABQ5SD11_9CHLO|nr:hypothetical protein VaNZ11_011542 [Volvox africanus]
MPPPCDLPSEKTASGVPSRAKVFLCSSYALAAWAWRSWEFIVALILIELYPDSLLMVSAYGILDNLARVLLGPAVGSYLDRHERLPGAYAMLRLQNLCIGGSAVAALVLLWPGSNAVRFKLLYWSLMWLLTIMGAASSSGSTGVSISVEREAVKALCGSDANALAALNSVMRAIDLSALLCAPLVAGMLMTVTRRSFTAAAVMAAYCCFAYVPEVLLLEAAFNAAPVLRRQKVPVAGDDGNATGDGPVDSSRCDEEADERTGLLAEYTDGTDGTRVRVAGFKATDAEAKSCFGCPAGEGAVKEGLTGEAQIGARQVKRAPGPGSEEDDDNDMGLGVLASSRLSQPLLLDAVELLPTSISSSCPDGGDGVDGTSSPAATTCRRADPQLPFAVSEGGKRSSDTSLTVLAMAAPTTLFAPGSSAAPVVGYTTRLRTMYRSAARQLGLYFDSWRVYWNQPVLLLCLALALLYMTVLSLGFLMTSFLKWSGLSEVEVSAYRGIGALTGLAATAIFPPLLARAGLRFCAIAGVTYQLTCLAAGVLPVVVVAMAHGGDLRPSVTQVRVLVAGLVSSRTGLWLYDLAVTQLIQEDVRQNQLGTVYGVQSSLQASFEMLSFVAGLINPRPARFYWLMLGSLGSVATAATMVWCYGYLRRRRGGASDGGGCVSSDAARATNGGNDAI